MVGMHGDLLNVGVAIDDVEQKVRHEIALVVGDDSSASVLLEGCEVGDGWGLVVCDRGHPKVSEGRAGGALQSRAQGPSGLPHTD